MVKNHKRNTDRQSWDPDAMAKAIETVINGELGYLRASERYDVPKTTLIRRTNDYRIHQDMLLGTMKGLGSRTRVFGPLEEETLVEYLKKADEILHGLSIRELRVLAYQVAEMNRIQHPFTNGMAGTQWAHDFMKRHPEFALRKPEKTSKYRAYGFNKISYDLYFDLLEKVFAENNFPAERVFNVDETGILTVAKSYPKVISMKGRRQVGIVTAAEKGTLVTVEVCISAAGKALPPVFILPGARVKSGTMEDTMEGSVAITSPSGWADKETFRKWFHLFLKWEKPTEANPILLVLDGATPHSQNLQLAKLGQENHVTIVCLPPHCTHKLQPVDVSLMGPVSQKLGEHHAAWNRQHAPAVLTASDIPRIFSRAFEEAAKPATIRNGFRKCGLYPLNRHVYKEEDFRPSHVMHPPANDGNFENSEQTHVPETEPDDGRHDAVEMDKIDELNGAEGSITSSFDSVTSEDFNKAFAIIQKYKKKMMNKQDRLNKAAENEGNNVDEDLQYDNSEDNEILEDYDQERQQYNGFENDEQWRNDDEVYQQYYCFEEEHQRSVDREIDLIRAGDIAEGETDISLGDCPTDVLFRQFSEISFHDDGENHDSKPESLFRQLLFTIGDRMYYSWHFAKWFVGLEPNLFQKNLPNHVYYVKRQLSLESHQTRRFLLEEERLSSNRSFTSHLSETVENAVSYPDDNDDRLDRDIPDDFIMRFNETYDSTMNFEHSSGKTSTREETIPTVVISDDESDEGPSVDSSALNSRRRSRRSSVESSTYHQELATIIISDDESANQSSVHSSAQNSLNESSCRSTKFSRNHEQPSKIVTSAKKMVADIHSRKRAPTTAKFPRRKRSKLDIEKNSSDANETEELEQIDDMRDERLDPIFTDSSNDSLPQTQKNLSDAEDATTNDRPAYGSQFKKLKQMARRKLNKSPFEIQPLPSAKMAPVNGSKRRGRPPGTAAVLTSQEYIDKLAKKEKTRVKRPGGKKKKIASPNVVDSPPRSINTRSKTSRPQKKRSTVLEAIIVEESSTEASETESFTSGSDYQPEEDSSDPNDFDPDLPGPSQRNK